MFARSAARRRGPGRDTGSPGTFQQALDLALAFLAPRPRSEQEVRRRLQRAGFGADLLEPVVAALRSRALLDDVSFAHYWVEQRQQFRPRGGRLLNAELRQLGVGGELAGEATAPAAVTAYEDALRAAQPKARLLRGCEEKTFKTRLSAYLSRRGFDWDVVSQVVTDLSNAGRAAALDHESASAQ